jgi:hypothetical protein
VTRLGRQRGVSSSIVMKVDNERRCCCGRAKDERDWDEPEVFADVPCRASGKVALPEPMRHGGTGFVPTSRSASLCRSLRGTYRSRAVPRPPASGVRAWRCRCRSRGPRQRGAGLVARVTLTSPASSISRKSSPIWPRRRTRRALGRLESVRGPGGPVSDEASRASSVWSLGPRAPRDGSGLWWLRHGLATGRSGSRRCT